MPGSAGTTTSLGSAEFAGNADGVQRAGSAKGKQRQVARVMAGDGDTGGWRRPCDVG